jgi:hypothetical protein
METPQEFIDYMEASLKAYERFLRRKYENANTRKAMRTGAAQFAGFLAGIRADKGIQVRSKGEMKLRKFIEI